jgi:hypothetical protein
MAITTSCFASNSKIINVLLAGKMQINNEWKWKVKINNINVVRDLCIILKENFIYEVKSILDM